MTRSSWLVMLLFASVTSAQEMHFPLNTGWEFRQEGKERWYPAGVPGVVQADLMRNGLVPDPYRGTNIDSLQWVEQADWVYQRSLFVADTLLVHKHLDLVFKGLDTFAEVYLNDSLIGTADNMFRTWEWDIKPWLRIGKNEVKVVFRSPVREGAKLRDAYGIQLPHDSDPSGVSPYVRKAAYQFGWDFCPRLVTMGIWQGVELRGWSDDRILRAGAFRIERNGELMASCAVQTTGECDSITALHVRLGEQHQIVMRLPHQSKDLIRFMLDSADLWSPEHPKVFALEVKLYRGGVLLSSSLQEVGFRSVTLDQTTDSVGKSFTFKVNGRPVFMKGCNMVPPDMMPGPASVQRWVDLVRRMQDAGMNMVRLWAGGIYPPDEFLHACDTAGILLWQDVMVGNMGPFDDPSFEKNIGREVVEQYRRISVHPCLALFCGNNELDVAWKNWGWQQRYGLHGADSVRVGAVNDYFFNKQLPRWLDGMGNTPYTPTSPLSNWGNAKGLTEGDLHYWGVWHGDSAFASFKTNVGRFVSEYGFQSYPDSTLLARYIDPTELHLGSTAMKWLQRSYKTDRPIWEAIEDELGQRPESLGEFIEASQWVQASGYGTAIEAHLSAQPHCMGTLLWQLNDCWPGPSWSLIDVEGNPKPAYDTVKQLYTARP